MTDALATIALCAMAIASGAIIGLGSEPWIQLMEYLKWLT